MKEAKGFGETIEVASSKDANYTFIPKIMWFQLMPIISTSQRTILFTELKFDWYRLSGTFGCRYVFRYFLTSYGCFKIRSYLWWCTEKLSSAGLAFIIVKDELLGKISRYILPCWIIKRILLKDRCSIRPVLPIYSALETLRWLKANGDWPKWKNVTLPKPNYFAMLSTIVKCLLNGC